MEKAAACWVFLLNNEVRDLAANNFCILATKFLLFNKKRRKHKLWKVGNLVGDMNLVLVGLIELNCFRLGWRCDRVLH